MCSRLLTFLLCTVCLCAAEAATDLPFTYFVESTDAGGVRFTDRPSAQSAKRQWVGEPMVLLQREVEIQDDPAANPFVEIIYPIEDGAVRSNAGNLVVHTVFSPAQSDAISQELMLNGRWLATSIEGTFFLENLERGRHQLKVRLKDAEDKVLAESQEVHFQLLRYAIPRD